MVAGDVMLFVCGCCCLLLVSFFTMNLCSRRRFLTSPAFSGRVVSWTRVNPSGCFVTVYLMMRSSASSFVQAGKLFEEVEEEYFRHVDAAVPGADCHDVVVGGSVSHSDGR